jgi:hypothetical protein
MHESVDGTNESEDIMTSSPGEGQPLLGFGQIVRGDLVTASDSTDDGLAESTCVSS